MLRAGGRHTLPPKGSWSLPGPRAAGPPGWPPQAEDALCPRPDQAIFRAEECAPRGSSLAAAGGAPSPPPPPPDDTPPARPGAMLKPRRCAAGSPLRPCTRSPRPSGSRARAGQTAPDPPRSPRPECREHRFRPGLRSALRIVFRPGLRSALRIVFRPGLRSALRMTFRPCLRAQGAGERVVLGPGALARAHRPPHPLQRSPRRS